MDNNIVWTPQPKQQLFLSEPAFEALYGGAAGGGKSDALLIESLRQIDIPTYRGIIFRRTFPQLEELITKSNRFFPAAIAGAVYNASRHEWRFPSGARVLLRALDRDLDAYKYQGHEYQFVGFDELTHFTWFQYSYLMSRCRTSDERLRCYIRATANPGGVGHAWVKERFISGWEPYKRHWQLVRIGKMELMRDRVFIPATVFDNQKLLENDPDYIANLGMLPAKQRDALLYGDWDTFSGQVFWEWRDLPERYEERIGTHVIEPFRVPPHWRRMRGFDFGYAKPFSVGWYTIDPDSGRMYRIRELYGCTGEPNKGVEWEPQKIAREIKRIEQDDPNLSGQYIQGVADPSIFDESRGESVAQMMAREGVYFEGGKNQRIPGKMEVHNRLAMDDKGRPALQVFRTCKHLIRTLPALVYDETDVEDIDTDMEDHAYDELRYVCMAFPYRRPAPPKSKRKRRDAADAFDPLDREYKQGQELEWYRRRA